MLPVSSRLHWIRRNSHLSSYLLDGGPGAAADVSAAVVTSYCSVSYGHPQILLVAFVLFKVAALYSKLLVCQL